VEYFEIKEKVKPSSGAVRPSDFSLSEGKPVEPELVLRNGNVSLYCLDFANRSALFVETPPDRDLLKDPFLYVAQYDAATHVVKVPFETLCRLSSRVAIDSSQLIFIYSVGRCGSTLVSRIFHETDGVESLSEPDVFTQIIGEWGTTALIDSEKADLLRACTLLQCAPGQSRSAARWVLKFRSMVAALGPMFHACFPDSMSIFLYRRPVPWMKSMQRVVRVGDPTERAPVSEYRKLFGRAIPILDLEGSVSFLEVAASLWTSCMASAEAMQRSGIPLFVALYEELNTSPQQVLCEMFSHCDLTTSSVRNLDRILTEDSQAGSKLSRASAAETGVNLSMAHIQELERLIRNYLPGFTSETILANTIMP